MSGYMTRAKAKAIYSILSGMTTVPVADVAAITAAIPPETSTVPPGMDIEDGDDEDMDWTSDSDESHESLEEYATNSLERAMHAVHTEEFKKYMHLSLEKTPDILNFITDADIREKDRIKLCEMYTVFCSQEPLSLEWMAMRQHVLDMFKKAKAKAAYTMQSTDKMNSIREKFGQLKNATNVPLKYRIAQLDAPENIQLALYKRYRELKTLDASDVEHSKVATWLNVAMNVPYGKGRSLYMDTDRMAFLTSVRTKLDDTIYGLSEVKDQIILFLNARIMCKHGMGVNIALVGPPGTGKSHISRSLADILGYAFGQIAVGGITNADVLCGHDYTYIGSKPGLIVQTLTNMKSKNGIMFFDEFDKIGSSDVEHLLLHITDPIQHHEFIDRYLGPEIPIDLSQIWFMFSMNDMPASRPLADRMFVIHIDGYTVTEKCEMVKRHILPKHCTQLELQPSDIVFENDDIVRTFIRKVSTETDKGIRSVNNAIKTAVNKIAFLVNAKVTTHTLHESALSSLHRATLSIDTPLQFPVTITDDLLAIVTHTSKPGSDHMYMYS